MTCKDKPIKLVVVSAPSGTGKSTLVNDLLCKLPALEFSISITSRQPRGQEVHGKEYYFVSPEEFRQRIANNELLEYVEVYKDNFYGTLKSELERIAALGKVMILDLDVLGALKIKEQYPSETFTVFIEPPTIEELSNRLCARATDTAEVIETRLQRAAYEITFADKFDVVIVNNDLQQAKTEFYEAVKSFLDK